MATLLSRPSPRPRPGRRPRILLWVLVACLAAVVIEVGAVTDGFGIGSLLASRGPSSSGSPGPNPYGEEVTAVYASLSGSGAGSFPSLEGTNLCLIPACPATPKEDTTYDPPVAGMWFFFNVSNVGSTGAYLSNFTLTTSGSEPHLFELVAVKCCYAGSGASSYGEVVTSVYFTSSGSGSYHGLAAYAIAASIPDDGPTGYALYFNATSP